MNSKPRAVKRSKQSDDANVFVGSGNVFKDLGLPDADEWQAKARLAHQICNVIEEARLTQVQVAKRLGVDQPKVSKLMRGRLTEFSTDRLLRFLNDLGQDVDIVIRSRPGHKEPGQLRVLVA